MTRTSIESPIAAPIQLGNDGQPRHDSDYELPGLVHGKWYGPVAPQTLRQNSEPSEQGDSQRLHENPEYQSLPRADGGKQAWFFLLGCFMMEALVWGEIVHFPSSIRLQGWFS